MRLTVIAWGLAVAVAPGAAHALELQSPDGRVQVSFTTRDFEGARRCPIYSVRYRGRTVIAPSRLGLELRPRALGEDLAIVGSSLRASDTRWRPVYGERSLVRDRYRELTVDLKEQVDPGRRLRLTFRAYNEGAAFCYTVPEQPGVERVEIAREGSEFRFTDDHPAWATYTAQGRYARAPLSEIRPGCERPLLVRVADDLHAALAEARLVDYARTKFRPLEGVPHALATDLGSEVGAPLPLRTPWRVVMLGESPGQLLERNDLLLNLNDPCAIADPSWIRPGKVIRETTLSTVGGKACVDFAVRHGLQYVEYDAGWYGPERTGDPRAVAVNPNRPQGGLDLQEVIRYANERGIGIILYVNQLRMEPYLDEILPLYRSWGVKGVKYGFVKVGSQEWTRWLHEAVRKAAQHRLMVDIHDEYRPTGYSRTYPNLLTQEGIRGDEEAPSNGETLDILFTRMLAGAADHTLCYYDARVDRNASHAFQLAKAVCFYSPFQFLYWYDRPFVSREVTGRPPDGPNVLGDEPELEFFDHVPTVWDDTRVLHGEIGEVAVIARRSGPDWFIGAMNGDQPRSLTVPLRFLEPGVRYVAHRYVDDPSVPTRTHVRVDRAPVERSTVLRLDLPARGGEAIRLVPAEGGKKGGTGPSFSKGSARDLNRGENPPAPLDEADLTLSSSISTPERR